MTADRQRFAKGGPVVPGSRSESVPAVLSPGVALISPEAAKQLGLTVDAEQTVKQRPAEFCRVYWGSHGCKLERGHDGPHLCDCADDPGVDPETREYVDEPGMVNVGAPPYYGSETTFYGEDATPQERGEA